MSRKKKTIEDVREYISERTKCKLLSNKYVNAHTKLKLTCHCGENFEVTWANLTHKTKSKQQCNRCSYILSRNKQNLKYRDVKCIIESESNCKLLSSEYINAKTDLELLCGCGSIFYKTWDSFSSPRDDQKQCRDCGHNTTREKLSLTLEEVNTYVKDSTKAVLLSKAYVNKNKRLKFKCECGNKFTASFDKFKYNNQTKCRECRRLQSRGEERVAEYLKDSNIKYIEEHFFEGCIDERVLLFDFYLPKYNVCIEYDGEFHYKQTTLNNDLIGQQYRDEIKNVYCKENNIKLIRIPYWEFNNIERILESVF